MSAFNIHCPCGKELSVPTSLAGKQVRCPSCSQVIDTSNASVLATPQAVNPTGHPSSRQRCHEIDYQIVGDDLQMVIVELDPGETVIAEAGGMTYMEQGIQFETKMGDGSKPEQGFFGKMMTVGKRMLTGESIFMTHFTHHGIGKSHVAFAAPYPGKIIPIDMATIQGLSLIHI